jgi:DNA-binding CsgD family transcriptional regulator
VAQQKPTSTSFSPREREVLTRLCAGETYHQIAQGLEVSPHTVDTYIRRLKNKTGAASRAELAALAVGLGMHGLSATGGASSTSERERRPRAGEPPPLGDTSPA